MERGIDALRDHAGTKPSWGDVGSLAQDPALEDELHLVGTPNVEIFADDLFEEDPSRERLVEYLGQREFRLQDRERVANAGRAVLGREGMREPAKPLPQEGVDLLCAEFVADPLEGSRVFAREDPVVECFVPDVAAFQLTLRVLVAVDAELHVVGKVGAELQEERTKVSVHDVEVVLIHHGRGAEEPGIGCSGLWVQYYFYVM